MKLTRHLFGYAPVKLASAIASFGGVYAFTRLLGPEEYGRYALLFSIMAVLHTLTLTWVEAAGFRFQSRAESEGRLADHHRSALVLMARSLAAALALWLVVFVLLRDLPAYRAVLPWIALLLPLSTIVQMALESHRAGERVARYGVVSIVQVLGGFLLGALLAWQTGLGAGAPFAGMAGALIVLAISEGIFLWKSARGGKRDTATERVWLAYGIPVAAALVLDIALSASDRFLIAAFLGESAVGAYAAGYGVADKTVLLICSWAAMAATPLMISAYETGGTDGAREPARGLVTTLLFLGLPAASGLALVAEPLAGVMIGAPLRAQAMQIIPWIAFAGLLNGLLIHYAGEAFQLVQRTGLRAALLIVPVAMNIGLNLVLLPMIGLMGAVYATVASYGVGVLLLGWVGRRFMPLPWPALDTLRIALACLAMWPATLLVPDLPDWPELFVKTALGGAVYVLGALALDAGGARGFVKSLRKGSARRSHAPRQG